MFWTIFWVIVTGAVLVRGMPEVYALYRHPREVRTGVISMDAQQARRAALAALIFAPIIWLVILFSSFGLIGRSQF
jgi:cobalamin synthase